MMTRVRQTDSITTIASAEINHLGWAGGEIGQMAIQVRFRHRISQATPRAILPLLPTVAGAVEGARYSIHAANTNTSSSDVDLETLSATVPSALVALGLASAVAVPLDVVPGEWATFRLADDLGASPALAAAALMAYAIGTTAGGFAGDAIVVRTGLARLLRIAAALSATSVSAASLVPSAAAALGGFFLAGFGLALIGPQFADAAALAPGRPGSGFAVLFIGNRAAGPVASIVMGTVATATGGIGLAMVLLTVPCAIVLIAVAAKSMPANDYAAADQERA
jgi:fucose permease